MSNTPELSNVARVLISRMESHPEDFTHDGRFSHLQDSLYTLLGMQTTNPYGGQGRLSYLSDADRAALTDAWRALNYKKFEKEVMDALFQSDAEREEEKKKFAYPIGIQAVNQAQNRVAMQNSLLTTTGTLLATNTTGTSVHPAQNSQNSTLGIANAFSGIFK